MIIMDWIAVLVLASLFILTPAIAYAQPLPVSESMVKANNKNSKWKCKNKLANWIRDAGFRGHNIREAWAIAMRESNGIPTTVSGEDYGLFQFNYSSWSNKLDWSRILDPEYNARAAFKLSKGGKSWLPWGMRDHREWDNESYAGIWSDDQFYAWVIEPYERYYKKYPCEVK